MIAGRKKILLVSSGLRVGGVERSLIGLLESFDYDQYDVSLFLYAHEGEFMSLIHLLPENKNYAAIEKPIKNILLSGQFTIALARLFAKCISLFKRRVFGVQGFLLLRYVRYSLPFLPDIPGAYNLAISFLTPHDPVLRKVIAKKKTGWIHTDYSTMECGVTFKKRYISAVHYVSSSIFERNSGFLSDSPRKALTLAALVPGLFLNLYIRFQTR